MKISASPGRENKIHISVDGEYRYTVDAEYWYTCPYCRKSEITDGEECEAFINDIGSRYAFISGLRILSYGDNSRKELTRKLVSKGHDKAHVSNALDKLEEYGYVNDRRYAELLTESLRSRKIMSKNGIKSELVRRGVDSETAAAVLEETEFDPVEDILDLLNKKYGRILTADEKGRRKTIAALQRLGYGWSEIQAAINRYNPEGEIFDD